MAQTDEPSSPNVKDQHTDPASLEIYVKIWSKAVDTQMHFNEMSAKSRQLGLTFATAALGVAILLLSKHDDFVIRFDAFGLAFSLSGAGIIVLATALAVYAVRILDLEVYHRMLRGAVTFGEDFEQNYFKQIVQLEKGMTQAISHYSRHSDADVDKSGAKYKYEGKNYKNARDKIAIFYRVAVGALCAMAAVIFMVTSSIKWSGETTAKPMPNETKINVAPQSK